ncbi:AbrB/MazE/SpoVT family DNA-binding domain-containing protein [Candidatus Uhrbacteria bacterium]|nr:AbrB/MazE/SpoVT family DNA-binding domain-containing protein [Candidatus Uhrbacteria bacterium]
MSTSRLSKKYQIVIPSDVRKSLKLNAGTVITVHPIDDRRALLVKHKKSLTDSIEGLGADLWKSLGGGTRYLKKERHSWEKRSR